MDTQGRKVYWSDEIGDAEKGVWRANLDGSSPEHIFKSPDGFNAGAITLTN